MALILLHAYVMIKGKCGRNRCIFPFSSPDDGASCCICRIRLNAAWNTHCPHAGASAIDKCPHKSPNEVVDECGNQDLRRDRPGTIFIGLLKVADSSHRQHDSESSNRCCCLTPTCCSDETQRRSKPMREPVLNLHLVVSIMIVPQPRLRRCYSRPRARLPCLRR